MTNIIKLNATPSTNDFLKSISTQQSTENFTVVITENQTKGKGQRGNTWTSEPNKNLIFSTLIKEINTLGNSIFDLNIAISISIIEALETFKIPNLNIKWPNDILSEGKKISGILIENTISSQQSISSIIGIGLNVNQTNFENLPKASSLKNIVKKEFNKEELLLEIMNKIKNNLEIISNKNSDILWEKYHSYLFKKNIPSIFELSNSRKFMGIIKKVLRNGKIQILLENDLLKEFDVKEIKLIY